MIINSSKENALPIAKESIDILLECGAEILLAEEFKNQFINTDTTFLKMVSSDSVGPLLSNKFDDIDDEYYETFVKWHLKTCEKPEILGTTCHVLYICKKN